MKQYFISKSKYDGEVVYLNLDSSKGYKVSPKGYLPYEGIKVNEMVIIKPSLIEKIIKRKIKLRLEYYMKLIMANLDGSSDSDDTRKALDDLQRYRIIVNRKYSIYLDEKYMALLNKKIDILEREISYNLNYEMEEVRKR